MIITLEHLGEGSDDRPVSYHEPVRDGDRELKRLEPVYVDFDVQDDAPILLAVPRLEPVVYPLQRSLDASPGLRWIPAAKLVELGSALIEEDPIRSLVVSVDRHVEEEGEDLSTADFVREDAL